MTDPRFDPAFQRGYSGPDPELVVRPRPSAAEVEPASSATDAAPQSVVPLPVNRSATRPAAALPPDPADESDPGPRPAVHNPYRLALLLAGVVLLIAAATTLYSQVQQPQTSNRSAEAQFGQLLIYNLPPALILGGFACIILWLALGALERIGPEPGPGPESESESEPEPGQAFDRRTG